MRTIHLYGRAAELFGPEFTLDVQTIPEAVHAICSQIRGFRQFLEAHDFHVTRGKTYEDGKELDEKTVYFQLKHDVHIMPTISLSGGKLKGIGKIIAGVLLAGFAFWAAPALHIATIAGMSVNQIGFMGVAMALSGVSALMSPQEDSKEKTSKIFNGVPEMAEQGQPVPLIYGKIRVDDPPVVSLGIETVNVAEGGATFSDTDNTDGDAVDNHNTDSVGDPYPTFNEHS
jgi:predicted phage tail protein